MTLRANPDTRKLEISFLVPPWTKDQDQIENLRVDLLRVDDHVVHIAIEGPKFVVTDDLESLGLTGDTLFTAKMRLEGYLAQHIERGRVAHQRQLAFSHKV